MPEWLDDMLEASIGGAPFLALSVRGSGGRRTVITEFLGRDEAAGEDLGQKARRWAVEAMVVGDDYMRARDAVVDVLEREGPHRFVHPWYGEISVMLDSGSTIEVTETAAEGRGARITFSVVEVGNALAFRIVPSPAAGLSKAASGVQDIAASDYKKTVNGLSDALAAISGAIGTATGAARKVHRKLAAALGDASSLTFALLDLDEAADAFASLPSALMAQVNGILGALAQLLRDSDLDDPETYPGGDRVVRVELALQAAEELHAVDVVTEGTANDPAGRAGEVAFNLAWRATSAAIFAELFEQLPLESADQAATIVASLGGAIESLMLEESLTDEAYVALTDLRAHLAEQARAAAQDLPTLTTYTPTSATPALLIAFWVHGDPGRDLEICARNLVRDPNFVIDPLGVLSG